MFPNYHKEESDSALLEMLDECLSMPDTIISYVETDYVEPYPDSLRYEGKVYLLNSHTTFSSASSLAGEFKHYRMGITVGEETGGMNISSGEIIAVTLPHSGFSLWIPTKIFYMVGYDENSPVHGILPDVAVPQKDALAKALQLIGKQ